MRMVKSQLLSGMKKATIEMLLLKLLAESDMYGYQLTQEVKKRSGGLYTILEGSMYPILYRLTDQAFISSYDKKVGKRQVRVYYHLEDSGREYLDELISDYHSFSDVITFLLDSDSESHYSKEDNESSPNNLDDQ